MPISGGPPWTENAAQSRISGTSVAPRVEGFRSIRKSRRCSFTGRCLTLALVAVAPLALSSCGCDDEVASPDWPQSPMEPIRALRSSVILQGGTGSGCGASTERTIEAHWILSEIPAIHEDTQSFQTFFESEPPDSAEIRTLGFSETVALTEQATLLCPIGTSFPQYTDVAEVWNGASVTGPLAPCLEIPPDVEARIEVRQTSDGPSVAGVPPDSVFHFGPGGCVRSIDSNECLNGFCFFNCF